MTIDEFRALAMSFPNVRYAANLGAINLMVGDKIFASSADQILQSPV